ncbi:MAG: hypothetical protein H7A37_01000 [Chlamydiales bacterium]|nr:hypothetical protein [Chlamydiia bacterium]MCP5506870.1 hypothetical protein [Chlamydiales bacterium]
MSDYTRKLGAIAILLPMVLFGEYNPLTEEDLNVDQRIEQLEKDSNTLKVKAMQIELESQPLMFHDWIEYTERMEKAKRHRSMAERIDAKIKELKKEKAKPHG